MKLGFKKALNIYTDVSADSIIVPGTETKITLLSPGFLVLFGEHIVFKQHCIIIDDTTSIGEMTAINMAVSWCKYIKNEFGKNKFNIFTDSESSIFAIKNYMNKYDTFSEEKFTPNTKKDRHPGLIRITDEVAYNIVTNELDINFIFIPAHTRIDININKIVGQMKKKILIKNPTIKSKMPDWKIYDILVGNAAIDSFTRQYLLKYKEDVTKEITESNIIFNVKREYPLMWKPETNLDTLSDNISHYFLPSFIN